MVELQGRTCKTSSFCTVIIGRDKHGFCVESLVTRRVDDRSFWRRKMAVLQIVGRVARALGPNVSHRQGTPAHRSHPCLPFTQKVCLVVVSKKRAITETKSQKSRCTNTRVSNSVVQFTEGKCFFPFNFLLILPFFHSFGFNYSFRTVNFNVWIRL